MVKERPDLDPTKYRKYGEHGRSECFGADDVMNQLPNHPISKQEWFSRCRSAGIEESVFLNHFETLLSSGLVLAQGGDFIRNKGAGAMSDIEPLLTRKEVAKLLQVSEKHLLGWRDRVRYLAFRLATMESDLSHQQSVRSSMGEKYLVTILKDNG